MGNFTGNPEMVNLKWNEATVSDAGPNETQGRRPNKVGKEQEKKGLS